MKSTKTSRKRLSRLVIVSLAGIFLMLMAPTMSQTALDTQSISGDEDVDQQLTPRGETLAADTPLGFPPTSTLWDYRYDVHSTDFGSGMALCADDGYAVVGSSWGLLGWANRDGFLIKTNSTGQREWTKGYGLAPEDNLYGVEECASGGFIIVGDTESYGAGNKDIWLIRTDSDGNMVWNSTFGGGGDEYGYAVTECSNGYFVIAGYTNSFGAGAEDAWVIMVDSAGDHVWNMTLGHSGHDLAYDIIQSSDGNLTTVGSTTSFGNGYQFWLIHLDFDGYHIWNETYGGAGTEWAEALVECSTGGYALTGTTTTYNGGSYYYADAWLVRVNETGDMLWHHSYPKSNPEDIHDLVESRYGGFLIVGQTIESSEWDALVIRTDSSGTHLWNWTYGDSKADTGMAVVEIADAGFAVAGMSIIPATSEYECLIFGVPDTPHWQDPPVDMSVEYDTPFSVDLNASTPHGLSHWWIDDTTHFSVDQTGIITNTVTLGLGSYGIQVSVNDSLNYILHGDLTVTVVDTTPPTWDQEPADKQMELGSKFRYDLNASDTFGIHHFVINDTAQFSVDSNGVITNKSMIPVGQHGIEITAFDPSDNVCTAEFTLTVEDTTSPTWVETPQDRTLELGQELRYDLNATDLSGIDSYWVNASADFFFLGGGVLTGGSSLPIGTYAIEVRAYDPYGHYCSCVIMVVVEDTLPPEWVVVPLTIDHEYGQQFFLELDATDPSGIHHFWVNDTVSFSVNDVGEMTNATYLEVGQYHLTVRAFDPHGYYCEALVTITVQDTTKPELVEIPYSITCEYGEDFEYTIKATDLSGIDHFWINDTIHFAISDDGVVTNKGTLAVGQYPILIRAYDIYANEREESTFVSVQDTTAPTFVDPPSRIELEYGEALSYQFHATDLSGVDRFEMDSFGGLAISQSGLLTNTTFLDPGIRGFSVQVLDIYGNIGFHQITIEVADQSTTEPGNNQLLIVVLAIGGFAAVVVVVVLLRRR